jgi:hypothetical protein
MIMVALDFLELGTIKAINIAYKAIPIEFCILAGRTEQTVAGLCAADGERQLMSRAANPARVTAGHSPCCT